MKQPEEDEVTQKPAPRRPRVETVALGSEQVVLMPKDDDDDHHHKIHNLSHSQVRLPPSLSIASVGSVAFLSQS